MASNKHDINIIITGAGGFLGRHLVYHFTKNPNVKMTTIKSRDQFSILDNISESRRIDVIIHAGFDVDFSENKTNSQSKNLINSRKVVEFANSRPNQPHLIFLSAAGILGVGETERVRSEKDLGSCDTAELKKLFKIDSI